MVLNVYRPARVRARSYNGQTFNALFDSVLADVFGPTASAPQADAPRTVRARLDVVDKGDRFEATVDLPGVAKEDIAVDIDGARVSVKAATRGPATLADQPAEAARVLLQERGITQFARSFELPADVAEEAAEARYENGVLTLVLPKKAVAQPRKLQVK